MSQEKKIKELKAQIESLKSEIVAYKRREEIKSLATSNRDLFGFLKNTEIYKIAKDPNNRLGKIVRLPRTVFRVMVYPEVIKDIKNRKTENNEKEDKKNLFYPIDFFEGEYNKKRLNLILEDYDENLIKEAFKIACDSNSEIRIVLIRDEVDPQKIERIIKKNKINKPKLITYYSSKDQIENKREIFKLEIGKKDLFITKAWGNNE